MVKHADPAGSKAGVREQDGLVMRAATRMMNSLAEILVGHLPYDMAAKLLRHAYLRAAHRKLEKHKPDKKITKSALALMSGLDTRMIKALEEDTQPLDNQLSEVLPYSCVLNNWAIKPEWLDPETGRPKRLKIYGDGLTFRTLVVRSIAKNISYQPVLDELVKKENVRIINGEYVELCNRTPDSLDMNTARTLDLGSIAINALQGTVAYNAELKEDKKRRRGWLASEENIPVHLIPEVQEKLEAIIAATRPGVVELLESYRNTEAAETAVAGVGMYYWQAKGEL